MAQLTVNTWYLIGGKLFVGGVIAWACVTDSIPFAYFFAVSIINVTRVRYKVKAVTDWSNTRRLKLTDFIWSCHLLFGHSKLGIHFPLYRMNDSSQMHLGTHGNSHCGCAIWHVGWHWAAHADQCELLGHSKRDKIFSTGLIVFSRTQIWFHKLVVVHCTSSSHIFFTTVTKHIL